LSTRKGFLAAAASTALLAATPAPRPSPKPSDAALVLAQRMRQFDPNLSDKEIQAIARGIDGNLKLGSTVNPKGDLLKNWDEPAAEFEVPA
jgi:hypothetical protein